MCGGFEYLVRKNPKRRLWIDSLCINQDDETERGHHVNMMSKIYSNGERNWVILRALDPETWKNANASISALQREICAETGDHTDYRRKVYYQDGGFRASSRPISAHIDQQALVALFSDPWFSRIWVVQEVALSKKSVCLVGSDEIGLDQILGTASWLSYKHNYLAFDIDEEVGLLNASVIATYANHSRAFFSHKRRKELTWGLLLPRFRQFRATREVDKVFALIGIYEKYGPKKEKRRVIADYNKPLAQVMQDVTMICIEEVQDLEVLRVKNFAENYSSSDGPASWVPCWHKPWQFVCDPNPLSDIFKASEGTSSNIAKLLRHRMSAKSSLQVEGIHLGTVEGEKYTILDATLRSVESTLDLLEFAPNIAKIGTIATTLAAGADRSGEPLEPTELVSRYQAFRKHLQHTSKLPPAVSKYTESGKNTLSKPSEYMEAMHLACRNRCLFRSNSGDIGIGPLSLAHGDVVAILFGLAVPALLRHKSSDSYEFIGVCFVDGFMFGEALQAHKRSRYQERTFNLE